MALKFLGVIVAIGVMSGCSLTPLPKLSPTKQAQRIDALTRMLQELSPMVNPQEAQDLAKTAVLRAKELGKSYEVVSPPLWHNMLVNIGVKRRGLCYHYSEDMLRLFLKKKYTTFEFYMVGANIGEYFEHNAIVVSAKKESYKEGIVLDAWRNSGNLFFDKVLSDKKYEWKNRATLYQSITYKLRHK